VVFRSHRSTGRRVAGKLGGTGRAIDTTWCLCCEKQNKVNPSCLNVPQQTGTPATQIAAASTTTARGTDPEEERMLQVALCATTSVTPHAATRSEPPVPSSSIRTSIFPSPPSLNAPFTPPAYVSAQDLPPASASLLSPRASLRRTTAAKCAECGTFPSLCTCPPTSTPPLPVPLQPPVNSLPCLPPSSKDAVV
jgi:hypothetical protein